jgi:uncharacterized protein HemX
MDQMDDPWRQDEIRQQQKRAQTPPPYQEQPSQPSVSHKVGCTLGAGGCLGIVLLFCSLGAGIGMVQEHLKKVDEKIDRIEKKLDENKPADKKPDEKKDEAKKDDPKKDK